VEVQVDEARREPASADVDGPGVGHDRLTGSEPRRDPAALDQQRAGLRRARLGVQKQGVAHHQAFHSARILPRRRRAEALAAAGPAQARARRYRSTRVEELRIP
jgi:hypothetical protein